MITIGVIAGSGAEALEPFRSFETSIVETPYGNTEVRTGIVDDRKVVFAPRHGGGHTTPPHRVNYKAIISALAKMEVMRIIGIAAVGSLTLDIAPGNAAVVTDFIDFRMHGATTFFDDEVVHTDFSHPYCSEVSSALLVAAGRAGLEVTTPCTYLCTSGPRFETPAEIKMFKQWGADVIGMTNTPEAILARELGICYGALAVSTNYAAGISPTHLSHDEVIEMMHAVSGKVAAAIAGAISLIPEDIECECRPGAEQPIESDE